MNAPIDLLLRGAILCALSVLALSILRNRDLRRDVRGVLALGFLICFGFYTIAMSGLFPDEATGFRLGLRLIDAPNMVFLWLFLLSIFSDDFRIGRPHLIIGVAYTGLMVLERLSESGVISLPSGLQWIYFASSVGLLVHLVWMLAKDHEGDLHDDRRLSRGIVIVAILIGTALSVALGNISALMGDTAPQLIVSVSTLVVLLTICGAWLNLQSSMFQASSGESDLGILDHVTLKEKAALERLRTIMEEERAFQDPTLKIGSLARQIGLGEHALRQLINQKIGYRNFPAFLNRYRIDFAKSRLSDPAISDVTILEIAMESGFNSLSAFNRAFRQGTGLTPRAYRKGVLK